MNRPIDQQDLDPNAGRELIDEKQNVKDWMRGVQRLVGRPADHRDGQRPDGLIFRPPPRQQPTDDRKYEVDKNLSVKTEDACHAYRCCMRRDDDFRVATVFDPQRNRFAALCAADKFEYAWGQTQLPTRARRRDDRHHVAWLNW